MKKILIAISLMAFMFLSVSCSMVEKNAASNATPVTSSSNAINSTISQTIPDTVVMDITGFAMLDEAIAIEQFFVDDSAQTMVTLQRLGAKRSAITIYSLSDQKTVNSQIFEQYIAKIKLSNTGVLLFSQDKIIKLTMQLEEVYTVLLPTNAYSPRKMDVSCDEKQMVYIDKEQNNIYTDTLPTSGSKLLLSAETANKASAISDVTFVNDSLIYFSFATENSPASFGLCDLSGSIIISQELDNLMPKSTGDALLLYQSMETFKGNNLHIYKLDDIENPDAHVIIATANPIETASTTISNNAQYVLTAQTNDASEDVVLNIYNIHSKESTAVPIPADKVDGTVNLMYTADCYFISNDAQKIIFTFNDDSGAKILFAQRSLSN